MSRGLERNKSTAMIIRCRARLAQWLFLVVLSCALWANAQTVSSLPTGQTTAEKPTGESLRRYYYKFENPNFEIVRLELKFDSTGKGTFTFLSKGNEEATTVPLELLPTTIERINAHLETLRFLESNEVYQGERDASYLGTATIAVHRGAQERQVSFNFTRNEKMRELAGLLRGITSQEYRVFLINLARRHEPLDLDKQLRGLESELKNGWLGEPEKLVAFLREIHDDDDILLMVRRRAEKLIQLIKKERR